MEREKIKNYLIDRNCPFRVLMDQFKNKWAMIIIVVLGQKGVMRFNELDKYIEDISQKVLASTLKMLEADGFVSRKLYPVVPPHVEYSLTEMGESLLPIIELLRNWSYEHIDDIYSARKK